MITCKLGEKEYFIDFVSGRALREIGPALEMYGKINVMAKKAASGETIDDSEKINMKDAIDELVRWFCILFKNQFTPDDVYDNYPSDNIFNDLAIALMAVQTQSTKVLSEFPMKAAKATVNKRTA